MTAASTRVARPRDGRIREWMVVLAALALCAVVIAPNFLAGLRTYDGGIAASAGTFTLHGLLPYRDYWLLYGPLSGLVVAVPSAVFGPSVELIRAAGFVIFLGQTLVAYLLARVWASRVPAAVIGVSAVVMLPTLFGLEVSAWPLAMTLGLAALYLSVGTRQSGLFVGLAVGLTFITRLDVGAYALLAVLIVRDRRAVLVGFGAIAVPFAIWAIVTTDPQSLVEQLIWYPLVGPRQFRGLPDLESRLGETGAIMAIPLIVIPRALIVLSFIAISVGAIRHRLPSQVRALLAVALFAGLSQLQTQARADFEHLAQAATPAILLLAVWYRADRPSLPRFGVMATVAAASLAVALLDLRLVGSDSPSASDRAILASSSWIQEATEEHEPIFVGLTSHRYTVMNPLLVYYLADRRPGVHDTMFNPGVTNTTWGQTRMVSDLERSGTTYLLLDREMAGLHESFNDSAQPGSTILDEYIATNFHVACDLGSVVIQERNGTSSARPPCPKEESLP